ncbi:hypothetical protein G6F36_014100 [Rhizopus arrhizus]|nr:hypothetical protein G6F36_014100 [Rhizopus arrhizus]
MIHLYYVVYIFLGCITLNYGGLAIASGVIIAVIGIAYVVLQFLKIEAPSNMRKEAFDDAVGYGGTHPDPSPTPYSQPQAQPATVNAAVV